MKRSVAALASILLAVALSGCGLFTKDADKTKEWQAADYYNAAKTCDELNLHIGDCVITSFPNTMSPGCTM